MNVFEAYEFPVYPLTAYRKKENNEMGFFDDLGKRVTGAGQKTVQKTREISEVARINSLISQNEAKINNLYYQIGKLYVSVHGNDCEDEFRGMVESVAELEQQISTFKDQIQDVKGVQRCEKCGAEVQRGVAYCSACGAALPKVEKQINPDDYMRCPSCGSQVKKGMRFCTSCGHPMTVPFASVTKDMSEFITAGEEVIEEKEKICPNCGAALSDDSVFCSECGTRL